MQRFGNSEFQQKAPNYYSFNMSENQLIDYLDIIIPYEVDQDDNLLAKQDFEYDQD